MERYLPLARRMAGVEARRLGLEGTGQSGDILGVAYLALCHAAAKCPRPETAFGAYARAWIRGELLTLARQEGHRRRVEVLCDPEDGRLLQAPARPEAGDVEELHVGGLLAEAWARLRPRQRAVVEAVAIDGRLQCEVARDHGISTAALNHSYTAAIRRLRTLLA